ncbi:hypothetical protein C8J56DRAFT_951470 [Mycena floridula]|nr:hypothetical protein C8J56DRAFT_951470 [Mycena floridula]
MPRQSGRLKANPPAPQSDAEEEEYNDDEREPEVEYKPEKKSSARTSKSGGVSRSARLRLLPTMPIDILFEIFSCLEPLDLVRLIRVNKAFRETLVAPNALYIWRAARRQHDAPDPVPGYTEFTWATFLFGASVCQVCGATGIREPDFAIMRKSCKRCLKAHLSRTTGHVGSDILKLVPYTHTTITTARASSNFYWIPELHEVVQRLETLEKGVLEKEDDAQRKLDQYKAQRLQFVSQLREDAPFLKQWHKEYVKTSKKETRQETEARWARRETAVNDRFLALGYELCDIKSIRDQIRTGPALTDGIWQRIRTKFEPDVIQARDARILAERRKTMSNVLDRLYLNHLKAFPPVDWLKLPHVSDLHRLSDVQAAFEAETGDITETSFSQVDLSSVTATWVEKRKGRLEAEVKLEKPFSSYPTESASSRSVLDLATIVFKCSAYFCRGQKPIIALDGVFRHYCDSEAYYNKADDVPTDTIKFSSTASRLASELITMAGLEPKVANPSDMDQLDVQYLCESCLDAPVNSLFRYGFLPNDGYPVSNWRQAILHAYNYSDHQKFRILSQEEKPEIFSMTYSYFSSVAESMCTHCLHHHHKFTLTDTVIEHVKSKHNVPDPVVGKDLISVGNRVSFPRWRIKL